MTIVSTNTLHQIIGAIGRSIVWIAAFITGVAWPIVVLSIFLLLRRECSALLRNITKINSPWGSAEFAGSQPTVLKPEALRPEPTDTDDNVREQAVAGSKTPIDRSAAPETQSAVSKPEMAETRVEVVGNPAEGSSGQSRMNVLEREKRELEEQLFFESTYNVITGTQFSTLGQAVLQTMRHVISDADVERHWRQHFKVARANGRPPLTLDSFKHFFRYTGLLENYAPGAWAATELGHKFYRYILERGYEGRAW